MTYDAWLNKGHFIQINGNKIFYLDINPEKPESICILHGYPSCSFDYYKVINYLTEYRIIIHDMLGFGLSDKPANNDYLLEYQAEIAIKLWRSLGIKKIHLIAHDYGTSVATALLYHEQSKEQKSELRSLTLCNGSMLIDMAKLRPIQRMLKHRWLGPIVARLASYSTFKRNMKNIVSDPNSLSENDLQILWNFLLHNNGRKVLSRITMYIDQRYQNYDKWIGALRQTKVNTLILWGEKDPVAVIEMANELNKIIDHSEIHLLKNIGHYPMLEAPGTWSKALISHIGNS